VPSITNPHSPQTTETFSILVSGVARGVHTFGVYAVDPQNIRSSTFSTTFSVIGALGSSLSGINLTPTIRVNPSPVPQVGTPVTFSGYSIPKQHYHY
jgi:hypothetical protein